MYSSVSYFLTNIRYQHINAVRNTAGIGREILDLLSDLFSIFRHFISNFWILAIPLLSPWNIEHDYMHAGCCIPYCSV